MFYTLFVTEDRKAVVTVTEKADKEAEKQLLESNGYKVKKLQQAEAFGKEETLKVWLEHCDLPMACILKESNFGYDREEPESDVLL